MDTNAVARPREMTIEAVVTRADGTVENLGQIVYWHENWLRRFLGRSKINLRRIIGIVWK